MWLYPGECSPATCNPRTFCSTRPSASRSPPYQLVEFLQGIAVCSHDHLAPIRDRSLHTCRPSPGLTSRRLAARVGAPGVEWLKRGLQSRKLVCPPRFQPQNRGEETSFVSVISKTPDTSALNLFVSGAPRPAAAVHDALCGSIAITTLVCRFLDQQRSAQIGASHDDIGLRSWGCQEMIRARGALRCRRFVFGDASPVGTRRRASR